MKNIAFTFGSLIGLALLGPFLGGCLGDDSAVGLEGTLNNACYPNSGMNNGLCQTPLVCVMNTCIAPTGAGGDDASGGSTPDGSSPSPDATTMADSSKPPSEGGSSPDATQGTMDGAQPMDGGQMTEAGGPANVVTNGDFSVSTSGQTYWGVVAGNGTLTISNGMGCVAVPANSNATLGWPEAPNTMGTPILAADSYTLKYTAFAMTGGNLTVNAKIGQTMSPYTADYSTNDNVTAGPTPFTHTFTPSSGDDSSAGIAFMIPQTGNVTGPTTVCFQNVSLVQN
jgi:hypothetical protein